MLYVKLPQNFFQMAINTWSSIAVLYNDHTYFANSDTWNSGLRKHHLKKGASANDKNLIFFSPEEQNCTLSIQETHRTQGTQKRNYCGWASAQYFLKIHTLLKHIYLRDSCSLICCDLLFISPSSLYLSTKALCMCVHMSAHIVCM